MSNEQSFDEFGLPYQLRLENAQSSWWVEAMHELGRKLLGTLDASTRALDVGCGTGATLRWISPKVERSYGIDVSIDGLILARQVAPASHISASSASALPFADASMDVIVSTDVLQHLPVAVRNESLREMSRVLKPGGRVMLRTNAKSLRRGIRERDDWHLIDHKVLRSELEAAGFDCTRITHANAAGAIAATLTGIVRRPRSAASDDHHAQHEHHHGHQDGHDHPGRHDQEHHDQEHRGFGIPKRQSLWVERAGKAAAAFERAAIVRGHMNLPIGHTLFVLATKP